MAEPSVGYVAECFWVGVTDQDLLALDIRASASAAEQTRSGRDVRYLGSILMRKDEVVLCLFEGGESSVRRAAVAAQIPFERILETASSPWAAAQRGGFTPDQSPA